MVDGDEGVADAFMGIPAGELSFGNLMDTLAPTDDEGNAIPLDPGAGEHGFAGEAAGADPSGAPAAGAEADGAAGGAGGTGGAGAEEPAGGQLRQGGGGPSVPEGGDAGVDQPGAGGGGGNDPATPAGGSGAAPGSWTKTPVTISTEVAGLAEKIEENYSNTYHEVALSEAREEYSQYFDALSKHPRLLVGQQVPALNHEGTETLRDTNDAREWQEAVKGLLVEEVRRSAETAMGNDAGAIEQIHNSLQLFQDNPDLVPGAKGFNVDLANKFAQTAKPYEVRGDDGKLAGYAIPVQPLIDQLRKTLVKTPPPAPVTPQKAATKASPPQAGLTSKAGVSGDSEDFSTLFGTLGLSNFKI